MFGRIHSIETMGLLDGPGIRTVVFMQGCPLRCKYCHNPDSWDMQGGTEMSPEELVALLKRYRPYYQKSGGGVTFSGGEPLMQPEFLAQTLKLCKEAGIHTCLDTSGHGRGDYEKILRYTDLILYDVKHIQDDAYQTLTGQPRSVSLRFLKDAVRHGVPLWLRHVVVPGITDAPAHLAAMKEFLHTIPNAEKVQWLPYHTLGVHKYEAMGIPYALKGVKPMEKAKLPEDWQILRSERRREA
jgi:pyruvate formate lyase activating enzyme